MNTRSTTLLIAAALASTLASAPAVGQEATGALYGRIADRQGSMLTGVQVELFGLGQARRQVTDATGGFRFLKLDPGRYDLVARADGFADLRFPEIEIRASRNTTLHLDLVPRVEEEITITTASPLLDERELDRGARIGEAELAKIPTARDPWALLARAPGVLVDRIQVGGARSQQPTFIAPGARARENEFLLDGVRVTDSWRGGVSSTYFDFDQFEEIQIVTGGTDVSKSTAGVSINLVTRRGTNLVRGSARYLLADASLQATPDLDRGVFPPEQGEVEATQLEQIENLGVEVGGPLLRDRLWGWGSWSRNDIVDLEVGGFDDVTLLENAAVKLNAQPTPSTSAVVSWNLGDKRKPGRVWFGAKGPDVSTSLQKGPTPVWKGEVSQMMGSRLFVTGSYGRVGGGFSVIPNVCRTAGSCAAAPEALWDTDGVVRGGQQGGVIERPSDQWTFDASYFLSPGAARHELRLGGRHREFDNSSEFVWSGGRNLLHIGGENFGESPGPIDFLLADRGNPPPSRLTYTSVWLQDTLSRGRLTANVGLRYDRQEGTWLASVQDANPAFPQLLPAVSASAQQTPVEWETLSPRLGLTWATRSPRPTLLRASASRFAGALTSQTVLWDSFGGAAVYLLFFDGDGDSVWTDAETDGQPIPLFGDGIDLDDPTSLSSPDRIDPELESQVTDEFLVSIERSVAPHLLLGLHLTYRRTQDVLEARDLVRDAAGTVRPARRQDFVFETTLEGELPDGSPYRSDFYALDQDLAFTGGSLLRNGERKILYRGASLTLEKRLTDRWMAQAHLNYGKAEWRVPRSYLDFDDPTDASPIDSGGLRGVFDNDGDVFSQRGNNLTVLQSDWSFNVAGLVQIAPERPWGFDLGGNVRGRQGYPLPFDVAYRSRIDGRRRFAQATDRQDRFRNRDVYLADLGVQKSIRIAGDLELILVADLFNVLNEGTVTAREPALNVPRSGFVLETLSPRVWRLGVRLSWR